MKISGDNFAKLKQIERLTENKVNIPEDKNSESFESFFKSSISSVNKLQSNANTAIEKLVAGDKSQTIQDTMIAVEKAELAFKTLNQVRQKVIDAYREVIKMQI